MQKINHFLLLNKFKNTESAQLCSSARGDEIAPLPGLKFTLQSFKAMCCAPPYALTVTTLSAFRQAAFCVCVWLTSRLHDLHSGSCTQTVVL